MEHFNVRWNKNQLYRYDCEGSSVLEREGVLGPGQTTPEEFENGGFTLKTNQIYDFFHTRKPIKCFPFTLRQRNLKAQQSQMAETLECSREHAHSKGLVQHGNHHFGRHFGFVFEKDSGRQIT